MMALSNQEFIDTLNNFNTGQKARLVDKYNISVTALGDFYYVNRATGDDDNDGLTEGLPFATITAAVSAASAYDTILVAGTAYQETDATLDNDYLEDVTIPPTKMGLRLIGMGNSPEGIAWSCSEADAIALTINARDCYVSGFRFRPNGATSSAGIKIQTNAAMTLNAMGTTIENCIFRSHTTTALAGILIDASNDITIKNCKFTSVLTAVKSISPGHSVQYRTVIKDCFVDDKCTNGFVLDVRSGLIKNNDFASGLTTIISTYAFGLGKDNVVTGHNFICGTDYGTNCVGAPGDNWLGNWTDQASEGSETLASGQTILPPA